nr:BatA domain-containing protein [Bacteroidota bacterium]
MKFLFPTFLFALFAIAIPIIIHLFNFRKFKKIYFTNVKFLKEVKQETQSKSKLKHLLVLCTRILAITFLVFAFAQPFIPSENSNAVIGDKVVSVYVDNSFSMQAQSEQGGLFEESRRRAREISDA